ncbi:Hypothetical predicted protein [Xyrichtys novacula]|uniref:Uncharacterized protein n=1 Tax=Xyrichtys novacula TaxID=13765 RepID=A0AAV1H333_XYRNO|nr:Hypothetical predicted protein [Xyrichtys novacula]
MCCICQSCKTNQAFGQGAELTDDHAYSFKLSSKTVKCSFKLSRLLLPPESPLSLPNVTTPGSKTPKQRQQSSINTPLMMTTKTTSIFDTFKRQRSSSSQISASHKQNPLRLKHTLH